MEGGVASRAAPKKRTANFREDETKLLIQLWGDPLIQNKLFLTHRKAPVMRILAANMQRRGFYRTPDEIKTRIRNLKCLYHRIKRTMACGAGLGTVDPDWPHYKAMDAVLSRQGLRKEPRAAAQEAYGGGGGALEGPKCEDIKQEIEIDFNDDWTTNDSVGSDYEETATTVASPPPLQPAPQTIQKPDGILNQQHQHQQQQQKMPSVVPSFQMQQTGNHQLNGIRTGPGSIPVPLLILNSMQPQQNQEKKLESNSSKEVQNDISATLKSLLEVQREHLEVERQRLEMEKQKLEFERLIGTQMVAMLPMFGGLLRRSELKPKPRKRPHASSSSSSSPSDPLDLFHDTKLLKTMLERGIKKYMTTSASDAESEIEEHSRDSECRDSGIHNDDSKDDGK